MESDYTPSCSKCSVDVSWDAEMCISCLYDSKHCNECFVPVNCDSCDKRACKSGFCKWVLCSKCETITCDKCSNFCHECDTAMCHTCNRSCCRTARQTSKEYNRVLYKQRVKDHGGYASSSESS